MKKIKNIISKIKSTDGNIWDKAFSNVEKYLAKFRKLVQPGDVLHLEVLVRRNRRNTWKFSGNAFVEKKLVAEANFTAMMVDK